MANNKSLRTKIISLIDEAIEAGKIDEGWSLAASFKDILEQIPDEVFESNAELRGYGRCWDDESYYMDESFGGEVEVYTVNGRNVVKLHF